MEYTEFHRKFYNEHKQIIYAVGENLGGLNLENQDVANANFNAAKLAHANFKNAKLINARFIEANLVDADFTNADLKFARFNEAKLYDASFKGANLAHADLNGALLPYNWFQFTYYDENDFDSVEILTYDAENAKIVAFGLHEPMAVIREYVNNNKHKVDNLGVSAKNYERMLLVLDFFEKLINMKKD